MTPILIVLGLLSLGGAIVAVATRPRPVPVRVRADPTTARREPVAPGTTSTVPMDPAPVHPFAHAPAATGPEIRP